MNLLAGKSVQVGNQVNQIPRKIDMPSRNTLKLARSHASSWQGWQGNDTKSGPFTLISAFKPSKKFLLGLKSKALKMVYPEIRPPSC